MTEQYDDDNEPHILRDGEKVRVSLMDAMSVREQRPLLHDGHGNPVGHRPGFLIADTALNRDEREQAYSDYERDLTAAYKTDARNGRLTRVPDTRDATTMEEIFAKYLGEIRNG